LACPAVASNIIRKLNAVLTQLHSTTLIARLLPPPCCCAADWLNTVAPYLLSPLFGVPSGAYRLHHVVMHHVEDNAAGWDLSSTEAFQRDSLAAFVRCGQHSLGWGCTSGGTHHTSVVL